MRRFVESYATYPGGRNICDKTRWKNQLRDDLEKEREWCLKKLATYRETNIESQYWRGYLQAIDRVFTGQQPTEIERALTIVTEKPAFP